MAYQCPRCGQYVQADASGAWIDQYGGRFCGGNPQTPHLAPQQGQYGPQWTAAVPPKPKRTGLIIGLAGGGAALVIAVVVTLILVNGGKSTTDTAASPPPSAAATTSSSAAPPADPDAPVPCDPNRPGTFWCFPKQKVTGQQFLDRLAQKQKWPCYKKGEKDKNGDVQNDDVGVCKAANDVDQPYLVSGSIGYDTETFQLTGTMSKVNMVASTGSREWKHETSNAANTQKVAAQILDIAVSNLWPDNKKLQEETKTAFQKLEPKCATESGASMDDLKERLSIGYVLSCSSISTIAVNTDKGVSTTYVQTMNIDVPLGGPNGR